VKIWNDLRAIYGNCTRAYQIVSDGGAKGSGEIWTVQGCC